MGKLAIFVTLLVVTLTNQGSSYEIQMGYDNSQSVGTTWYDYTYMACKARYDELVSANRLFSSATLSLAAQIQLAMDTEGIPKQSYEDFRRLKYQLPTAARMIVFGENLYLTNKRYQGQFAYASNDLSDQNRRRVFTYVPGKKSTDGLWKFSTLDGGKTFFIKSTQKNEYLYPVDDNRQERSRPVFTWVPKTADDQCLFTVEVIGMTEVRIKNVQFKEYLYADSTTYDSDKRNVYTWRPGGFVDDSFTWIVSKD